MFDTADLRFVSEGALLIEFGHTLDQVVHQKVLNLDAALSALPTAKHFESLPTYRSLLIKFDPFVISHKELLETVSNLSLPDVSVSGRKWRVPICFDSPFSQDMAEYCDIVGLCDREVVDRLIANPFKLYMYGFAAGFAYLGGLEASLNTPRRLTPRAAMPSGSFIVAGGLAGLSSVSLPTGWYVLGQIPFSMFSVVRDPMVPFSVGDQLQLYSITGEEFAQLQAKNQQPETVLTGVDGV